MNRHIITILFLLLFISNSFAQKPDTNSKEFIPEINESEPAINRLSEMGVGTSITPVELQEAQGKALTRNVPFDPTNKVYEYEANPNSLDTGVEERWKLQKEQERLDLIKNILIGLFTATVLFGAWKFIKVYKNNKTNGKDS